MRDRGAPTNWRAKSEEQVRTQKEIEQARGTHILESTGRRIGEDTEGKQVSEEHSLPREFRLTDK
jgi:hypothetical protein